MSVPVDMTPEQVTYMWCQFKRARAIMRNGIAKGDKLKVGFALGWLDALLDELSDKFPADLDPHDSNPSNKP
jgi:hypothetical protein